MRVTHLIQVLSLLAAPIAAAPDPRNPWEWKHWSSAPNDVATSTSSQAVSNPTQAPSNAGQTPVPGDNNDGDNNGNGNMNPSTNLGSQPSQPSATGSGAASSAVPTTAGTAAGTTASKNGSGLVFAHYMLVSRPMSNDYATDMVAAKAMGVDAFAVNYGGWTTNYQQQDAWLTEFYGKAAANGMKAFLSIDTTISPTITPDQILNLTKTFATHPAQLMVDGQPLLTSFEIDSPTTWNWKTDILSKVSPEPLFIACSLSDSASNTLTLRSNQGASGGLTWILPQLTAETQKALDEGVSKNKGNNKWLAAVAPWYFKRTSASANLAHAQDDAIFVDRFANLLALDPKPDFIELVTWNDYGESHYIAPQPSTCDGCAYGTLNHTAFQRLAKPFIAAFKSGATTPVVEDEEVFMFYRTQKASVNAGPYPLPQYVQNLKDDVFVVGALKQPATVTLTSGSKTTAISLGAGVQKTAVPFSFGDQQLTGSVGGKPFTKKGISINEQVTDTNDNIVIV